jgi:hypothetical protein
LLAALLAPVIATGAGLAGVVTASKGFRAGKYYNPTATIASLGRVELRHASTAENIEGLLLLARAERRVGFDEVLQLQAWEKYNNIPAGDQLLLHCLKEPKCEPLACADIAGRGELHREVVLRQPGMNLSQANKAVGDISERVMVRHFESTGWQRIEGQIGRGGIDGLFVKRNGEGVVREVLVVESKYNTGTLQPTNHGQQMSRDWVERKLQQLRERRPDDATYRKVEELINGGFYRARLWTMRVDNGELQIDLQRVRSGSDKVDDLIDDPGTRVLVPPAAIRISNPKDNFEKTIVKAYREELGKLEASR